MLQKLRELNKKSLHVGSSMSEENNDLDMQTSEAQKLKYYHTYRRKNICGTLKSRVKRSEERTSLISVCERCKQKQKQYQKRECSEGGSHNILG